MTDATATFGIGDTVPPFELADTEGHRHRVPAEGEVPKATVIVVTCNHCPYVKAWNPRLRALAEDYAGRGVRFLQINSNDDSRYPADSLDHMKSFVREASWPIPYLHDPTQEVARALDAKVTPEVYVLDAGHTLRYRGAPDSDHQDESQNAAWARAALDALLSGSEVERPETPARGCSVKWR